MWLSQLSPALLLSCSIITATCQYVPPPSSINPGINALRENATTADLASSEQLADEAPTNQATVRTKRLSNSLFEIREKVTEKNKRQANDNDFTLHYSHDAIQSANYSLAAVRARRSVVDQVLRNAIAFASTRDRTEFRESFNTSIKSLALIVNAIASTSSKPTFNWAAYAEVAGTMLNDTASLPGDRTESWVGAITDPSGAFTAEIAIVPDVLILPPDTNSTSLITANASTSEPGLRKPRRAKRTLERTRPVRGLDGFSIRYIEVETSPVPGHRLVTIMDEALTTVRAARIVRSFTEYFTPVTELDDLVYYARSAGGAYGLAFRALQPTVLERRAMMLVLRELRHLAVFQEQIHGDSAFAIEGRLQDHGITVGFWAVGGPPSAAVLSGAMCPFAQHGRRGGTANLIHSKFWSDEAQRACIREGYQGGTLGINV
ncbi:MAG: hypothetical protein M1817_006646 [Caeruleum heppii]|nr:MAG: hypothetical protein M1817_006646 [Caeruleum heppii]